MVVFHCRRRRWKIFSGVCIAASCIFLIVYYLFFLEKDVEDYILWVSNDPDYNSIFDKPEPQLKHPLCGYIGDLNYPDSTDNTNMHLNSTCSLKATLRGKQQKVVSFSFYGASNNTYFQGIEIHVKKVMQLYPGWVMRVYHNIDPLDLYGVQKMCAILRNFPHVDDCYVRDLPTMGNIEKTFGSIWRFAVLGDPLVETFVVRDLDSLMLKREVDAVEDWLKNTNTTWHFMRDNKLHGTPILAGMWGARNVDLHLMAEIRDRIFTNPSPHFKTLDQVLLEEHVYIRSERSQAVHDSFHCLRFPQGWRPFPSQRDNFTFVGGFEGMQVFYECPWQCRPKEHKDWIYC